MFRKRIKSIEYALQGLRDMLATQPNARIHLVVAAGICLLALWLGLPAAEWAILLLCIGWVLSLEALNTALEYLTDLVAPDHHPLAGKAKDAAAGAVLLGAITAVLVGLLLLGPKLIALLP